MKKGESTKLRIMEAARGLFAELGYSSVTMKDVCDAAEISRGGLYAHFSSTADILEEIISLEQKNALDALEEARRNDISPYLIIKRFILVRAEEISDPSKSISGAVSQFAKTGERGRRIARERALNAVKILTEMIGLCQKHGLFIEGDPETFACGILWLIEGMNAHAELFGMDKNRAEKQLLLSVDMLKKTP